jgi:hypothetical protein
MGGSREPRAQAVGEDRCLERAGQLLVNRPVAVELNKHALTRIGYTKYP